MSQIKAVLLAAICLTSERVSSKVTDKPGSCPPFFLDCVPQDGGCQTDAVCYGAEKCCQVDCGPRQCVKPEDFKCPFVDSNVQCFAPPHDYCEDVFGCGAGTKCCVSSQCNDTTCLKSTEEKDGFCPYFDNSNVRCRAPTPDMHECQGDLNCGAVQKCCPGVCGVKKCTQPVVNDGDKLGQCKNEIETDCSIQENTCSEDRDCLYDRKCCNVQCEDMLFQQCRDRDRIGHPTPRVPVKKTGTCPLFPQWCPEQPPERERRESTCSDDSDCNGLLCCQVPCQGKHCFAPDLS